jgi:hypothetical protein
MSQPVEISKVANGYIVKMLYPDSFVRDEAVFKEFPELIEWLQRHFDEDKKAS